MTKIINSYHPNFSGGIGDFLRGCIYLHQKCVELGYSFEIDFKHHPINAYMYTDCKESYHIASIIDVEKVSMSKNINSNWQEENKRTIDTILERAKGTVVVSSLFSEVLSDTSDSNIEYIKNFDIPQESKDFIKNNIHFSDDIIATFNKTDYEVIHFRLGDRQTVKDLDKKFDELPSFVKNNYNFQKFDISFDKCLQICYDRLKNIKSKELIVMSDCNKLKKYIKDNSKDEKITIMHLNSSHTSKQPALRCMTKFSSSIKSNDMFYTALDVYVLSNSCSNASYSVYSWGSGFVCWITKVFDIPLILEHI